MKTVYLSILTILISLYVQAQANKVGVNTTTPTENMDVNGVVRLRAHPEDGETNAIHTQPDGTASSTKDQTFNVVSAIAADSNGVVGQIEQEGFVVASVTKTFIAPSGGFGTGSFSNPPYTVDFGPFSIGFYQRNNNNKLYCAIKTNIDTAVNVDLREFTGSTLLFPSGIINLTAGTWYDLDDAYPGDNYYFVMNVDAWYADIRIAETGRVYLMTVLGAKWNDPSGSQGSPTIEGDQFTVNLMQLSHKVSTKTF